jgi:hypothetical protein
LYAPERAKRRDLAIRLLDTASNGVLSQPSEGKKVEKDRKTPAQRNSTNVNRTRESHPPEKDQK